MQRLTRLTGAGFTRRWALAVLAAIAGALLLLRLVAAGCQQRGDGIHPGSFAERMTDRQAKLELVNAMIDGRR